MKKIYLLVISLVASFSLQAQDVVISQFFGGNSTTNPYNQDFVEVFNKSLASVDVSGWTIQYGAAGATSNINIAYTFPGTLGSSTTVIASGKYYLVGLASVAGGTSIPTPDGVGATNISGTNGKIAIVKNNTALLLTVTNPINQTTFPNISDFVGFGSSNLFEGTALSGVLGTTIAKRLNEGCTDSNVNSSDFTVITSTTVRNSSSAVNICSSAPTIAITSPANATIFSPETTNVNVALSVSNFNVANGTGDGHIRYTINGGAGVMKYDTTPIAVPTTPGAYAVYVELVDNSNVAIVPAQNATVSFTVASYTTIADLATLRTQVLNGYYSLSSAPVTTHVRPVVGTGMATRNQKYIQDATGTGAILIDDATGVLNGLAIAESEAISGLKGQLTSFSSVLQLVPLTSVGVVNNPATPIVPAVLTFADITANPAGYRESELVNLGNVTFSNLIGTPFAVNTNYTIGQGADTTVFRTLFNQVGEVDYIGTTVPTTADVIAIVTRNGATKQVVVRKLADMTNLSRNSFDAISGLNIYPNPAKNFLNITSSSLEAKTVAIYNVLGAQVLTANVTNAPINIASLSKGVYVVKVTEEGKTATRKLVIE